MRYNACIFLFILTAGFVFHSCAEKVSSASKKAPGVASDRFIVIDQPLQIIEEVVYDKFVVFYPGGYLETSGEGKVIFKQPFSVLGDYQVFDDEINIEFNAGTASVLNPTWFGAQGYDEADDTKAVQKLFSVVASLPNAIRIEIPIGKFILSEQIIVESTQSEKAVVHLQGISNSNWISGSSFVWNGDTSASMFVIRNVSNSVIENLDFNATAGKYPKHNLELRPFTNQLKFTKCTFGGCAGEGSANINLNEGNNDQVSEIFFENCLFRGVIYNEQRTMHALIGGWANTKDFYFRNCSFGPYAEEALKFTTTDILLVEGCTFLYNDIDISCETCKSYIISNYSEGSAAFWSSTASANFNATTMINNQFTGIPKDGFVVRDGSGTLVMVNNNFGTGNYNEDLNRIRWEENEYSTIYSLGNVFKNSDSTHPAFYNRSNTPFNVQFIESIGDLGGLLGGGRKKLEVIRQN